MTRTVKTDFLIFGGGIAGLWMLNRLRRSGYDAILLEKSSLGSAQTLASQGIIHGGLKYALNGVLSPASSAISGMPERWRQCLKGEDDMDLRQCKVLSQEYFMWSSGGYRSRLKTFLGSKALRGRIDALSTSQYPPFFQGQKLNGSLYKLSDFVVDTPSLIRVLAQAQRDRIFQASPEQWSAKFSENGAVQAILLNEGESKVEIQAQRYVLSAGEGNAQLLAALGRKEPEMQTRPLHMVALKLDHPHPAYLHCIGDSFGMTPRLTITSHPSPDGKWVWYIGGEIAESGVERSQQQQIDECAAQLSSTFDWVDFSKASWFSFPINRAEPRVANLQRPDTAYLHASDNLIVSWPTKLTLTPNLGDSLVSTIQEQGLSPRADIGNENLDSLNDILGQARFGEAQWESAL
ncbi:MAG: FAD-dependent oxidoreductase [Pseudohongiellaceae bacterium]|nr:FAD-dependent oxidoreductase [Pseudohongiellaceae bacterium]